MHDLLGSQRAPGMAAHPVGYHSESYAPPVHVRQYRHTILLFLAVPLMLRCAGID